MNLTSGALLRVLSVGERDARGLTTGVRNFHALLPLGIDFEALETLPQEPRLVQVEALSQAEGGMAALNSSLCQSSRRLVRM